MEEAMLKLQSIVGCAMRGLMKVLAVVLGVIVVLEITETVLMTWGLRSGNSRVIKLVTWYHKHVTNPVMVRFFAGRSAHSALLHHVGRRSGKVYLTPLTAHRSGDTIIVPLPYGTKVDWLRNLQAAGGAVVELDGGSFDIDRLEVVPVDSVMPLLPPFVARLIRLHDTKDALRMHVAGAA
jgi:deazaflavin-dependent oxidoreductase (nitroreductase family)